MYRPRGYLTTADNFLIREQSRYLLTHSGAAQKWNIAYGRYGIIAALTSAAVHLPMEIHEDVSRLLLQKVGSFQEDGFGLLYGYSGMQLFQWDIQEKGFTSANPSTPVKILSGSKLYTVS